MAEWKKKSQSGDNITIENKETGEMIIVPESNIGVFLPVEGYERPAGPPVPEDTFGETDENITETGGDAQRNPNDERLKKIVGPKIIDPFNSEQIEEGSSGLHDPEGSEDEGKKGVHAIMNNFAIVQLRGAFDGSDGMHSLIDTPGKRKWYEDFDFGGSSENQLLNHEGYSKDVTVSKLIDYGLANKRGTTPYFYSDFAYCKYFNKIPNNNLITLRRYAVPTFDSLDFPFYKNAVDTKNVETPEGGTYKDIDDDPKEAPEDDNNTTAPPVAQAITWLGEDTGNKLSEILSFSVGLPWKELESSIHENTEQYGDAENLGFSKGIGRALSIASGEATKEGMMHGNEPPPDPYAEGPYVNRIQGPVNRIDAVQRRKEGLTFTHDISLNFHYTARSIGGINTKAAMLDIISNFLLLTYGTGAFWGGANRWRGSMQSFPWKKGMAAWYKGDAVGFQSAIRESVSAIGDRMSNFFNNVVKDPIGTLKSAIGSGAQFAMLSKLQGKSPMFHGLRALLTGEPTGSWHLVIGNPFNPIMMIGNLVCDGCDFTFSDELGPDDFPTEMTITVKLKHGMARDRYGVESMFNKGSGRIYTLPDGFEEKWSGNVESQVDKHTGSRNPYINKVMGRDEKQRTHTSYDIGETNFDAAIESGAKTYEGSVDQGAKLAANIEMKHGKK